MATAAQQVVYRFGDLVLDLGSETLRTTAGTPVALRLKSFSLLRLLVENSGRLVTRETIMDALWPNLFVTDDNITQCVGDVRRALGPQLRHLLRTIQRRGYLFDIRATLLKPNASAQLGVDTSDGHPATSVEVASVIDRVWYENTSPEPPVRLSVRVLPLQSVEGSGALDRLGTGLTEDMLTGLSKCLRSFALGPAHVFFHDDRVGNLESTSLDRGADYLLRGSLNREMGIYINLQLSESASGLCIWAEQYELHPKPTPVARMVADVSLALTNWIGRQIGALPPSNLTVNELLLRGQTCLLRPASPLSRRQALCCFEQALLIDPGSVGSRLGIARVLIDNLTHGWSHSLAQDEARAEALLFEAVELGTDITATHSINGTLRRVQGRLDASRVELEIAADLAPHSAITRGQLGMTLIFQGRPEAAFPHLESSVQIGVNDPQAPLLLNILGMCQLLLGDVDAATYTLRKAEVGNPHYFGTPLLLAASAGFRSAPTEASANLKQSARLCPALGSLSRLRTWMGRQAEPDFMPIYEHMIERGLQSAGMPDE